MSRVQALRELRMVGSTDIAQWRLTHCASVAVSLPDQAGAPRGLPLGADTGCEVGVPRGIRTPVTAVKGRCPRPLDDGDARRSLYLCVPAGARARESSPRRARDHGRGNNAWGGEPSLPSPKREPQHTSRPAAERAHEP